MAIFLEIISALRDPKMTLNHQGQEYRHICYTYPGDPYFAHFDLRLVFLKIMETFNFLIGHNVKFHLFLILNFHMIPWNFCMGSYGTHIKVLESYRATILGVAF